MNKFLLLLPLLLPVCAHAQGWNNPQSNTFATCLVSGDNGDFWAGADDEGLFHRAARGNWTTFAGQKELGDASVTCVTVDPKHRVWVGTASAGLAVWNGANWKRFSVLNGPLSGRVNDLEVAPNGDVWGATDAGLFRWNEADGWSFPGVFSTELATRQLALAPVYSIAFDSQNRVLAACDEGLNRLTMANGDARIEALGRGMRVQPPSAQGEGFLPGPVHAVAVDSLGQIWCATRFGVCVGKDSKWRFLRGADWLANAKGSAVPLQIEEANAPDEPLAEDWATTFAPTKDGKMWIGFRQKGAEQRDCQTLEPLVSTRDDAKFGTNPSFSGDYVNAIVPTDDGAIFARYGGGLASLFGADLPETIERDFVAAPMPENAQVTQDVLVQLAKTIGERAPLPIGEGEFYSLDRQTRGDWPLRYGNEAGELLGMRGDHFGDPALGFGVSSGPHRAGAEADVYIYTQWVTSQNPNVLQVPGRNRRTQSEINDGTWQDAKYPPSFDGPDLWATCVVPSGLHRVSLYWFNKDGHSGSNRQRDHRVELFPGELSKTQCLTREPLAKARLWNGWNGEYASFALRGPARFQIRIARDRSHATQLQGIFFDQLGAPQPKPDWLPARLQLPLDKITVAGNAPLLQSVVLWGVCNDAEARGVPCRLERLIALRAAESFGAPESLLAAWRVQAGVWDEEGLDRKFVALPDAQEAER